MKNKIIGIFVCTLLIAALLISNPMSQQICSGLVQDPVPEDPIPIVDQILENIEIGDLLFMDFKNECSFTIIGPSNDHVALYVKTRNDTGIDCSGNDWFIEAGNVNYVNLDTLKDKYTNFMIVRVITANPTQIDNAVQWARGMEEKGGFQYQDWRGILPFRGRKCDPDDCDWPCCQLCDEFYCSEFVWAAYYQNTVEIDIDFNEWGVLPYLVPCVNMGVPKDLPSEFDELLIPYAYVNEIQIDDDVDIVWTQTSFSPPIADW